MGWLGWQLEEVAALGDVCVYVLRRPLQFPNYSTPVASI